MKKILLKSKKKRKQFNFLEHKIIILKSIYYNNNFTSMIRWNNRLFLSKIKLGITKLTKRCLVSNRKNIYNGHYKISRIVFLNCARRGFINGLIKST